MTLAPACAAARPAADAPEISRVDPFGPPVEWSGTVTAEIRDGDDTCFEFIRLARRDVFPETRFVACSFGYYDPARYGPGHGFVVAGNLSSTSRYRIGGRVYVLPLITSARLSPLREPPPHFRWPWHRHYGPFPFWH